MVLLENLSLWLCESLVSKCAHEQCLQEHLPRRVLRSAFVCFRCFAFGICLLFALVGFLTYLVIMFVIICIAFINVST